MEEKEIMHQRPIKRRVISPKNLPTKFPFWESVVFILLWREFTPVSGVDRFIWGLMIGALLLKWLKSIYSWAAETNINIFVVIDALAKKELAGSLNRALETMLSKHQSQRKNVRQ